jgi:hypothetical protein
VHLTLFRNCDVRPKSKKHQRHGVLSAHQRNSRGATSPQCDQFVDSA